MPDQVRCPNCGGYRASKTREYVVKGSRKINVTLGPLDYLLAIPTLGLYLLMAAAVNSAQRKANPVYREYRCYVCGYEFAEGDAPPSAANPELLTLGAEQRRREEQLAAAAYHQQRSDRDR
jgi:DNA-directed RNA polymerase subunit RPC12/RpoP